MKNKLIIKFNSGKLAILCSKCSTIIKTGIDFSLEEKEYCRPNNKIYLPPQYCKQCKPIETE